MDHGVCPVSSSPSFGLLHISRAIPINVIVLRQGLEYDPHILPSLHIRLARRVDGMKIVACDHNTDSACD